MKSIGISDEVYDKLLEVKHYYEQIEKRVISYDEIIQKLINLNGEDRGGEDKKNKTLLYL